MSSIRKLFAILPAVLAVTSALSVDTTTNADTLAKAVLGQGIQLVKASFKGSSSSAGTFSNGPQGIRNAAVLTSGEAADVISDADDDTVDSKTGGQGGADDLCGPLTGDATSYDATVLSMDVELDDGFDGFAAEFVFATEEYPEYVGTAYNDVFGIFVDKKQVAFDNTGAPITVNGPFFSSSNVLTPPSSGSSYQGSTPLLRSGAKASPGKHHIDIAICDISDTRRDSSVFVAINACNGAKCKSGTQIIPDDEKDDSSVKYPTASGSGGAGGYGNVTSTATYVTKTYTSCPGAEQSGCVTSYSTIAYPAATYPAVTDSSTATGAHVPKPPSYTNGTLPTDIYAGAANGRSEMSLAAVVLGVVAFFW